MRGKVDVAFLRREAQAPGLTFKFLIKEPLVAVLPKNHRLAAHKEIKPQDLAAETYITPTRVAPVLKAVIDGYAAKSKITLKPEYDAREFVFRDVVGGVHRWRHAAPALRAESTVIRGSHTPIAGAAAND